MDEIILQVRHYGWNIFSSEALWMEHFSSEALWMKIRESVYVIRYFACCIAGCGILDKKILGEALSRVEGLDKGIPHYLPINFG
jgi:hypothetical protein